MKLINSINQNLKAVIFNHRFLFCVIITTVLFFSAQAYSDYLGNKFSVIEVLLNMNRIKYSQYPELSSYSIFINSVGSGYFGMFIPILASCPFILTFCEQRKSGFMQFEVSRCGYLNYYFSKFIASFISGGFVAVLGYVLFGLLCLLFFPLTIKYALEIREIVYLGSILKSILGVFLFGAVSTFPSFVFSSFSKNKYINTCIPFMLIYIYDTAFNRIFSFMISSEQYINTTFKLNFLRADALLYIKYIEEITETLKLTALNIFLTSASFLTFFFIMNRRFDKCD